MTSFQAQRWAWASAGAGFAAWIGAGMLGRLTKWDLSIYEWLFLLAPLVIVPLALRLLLRDFAESRSLILAVWLQPLAAMATVLSFGFPPGVLAGAATLPWLSVCALLGLAGLACLGNVHRLTASALGAIAGMLYLTVGGVALLMSRMGIAPLHLTEPIVLLTAVHFHFTGFATPVFAGTVYEAVSGREGTAVHRGTLAAILTLITATPLLALGWLLDSPAWKLACVLALVGSLSVLAVQSVRLAFASEGWINRVLLTASGLSVLFGMVLAGLYGLGEFAGLSLIGLHEMARLHGVANGVGFSLCGLLGMNMLPTAARERALARVTGTKPGELHGRIGLQIPDPKSKGASATAEEAR